MHFLVLFHRFRWLHLPATFLVLLLQRTPVLRLIAAGGPGFALRSADILKSAFAVAALGAYNSVTGATTFNSTATAPATATPASAPSRSTVKVGGVAGSPFNLALNVTGAPGTCKSWKVAGAIPAGLGVSGGTVSGNTVIYNGLKLTLSGTPSSATNVNLTVTAYDGANATGDNTSITCALAIGAGVESAPSFATQPVSRTVVAGANVTFTVTVTGNPAPALQWYKDGDALPGKTAATLSLTAVQSSDAGDYVLVATNSVAPAGVPSDPATLTVHRAPEFSATPTSRTVGLGSSVTFSAAASGNPAPTYSWKKDGVLLTGQNGPSLTLDPVTFADAGRYVVTAFNSVSPAGVPAPAATLTVIVPAPAAIVDPGTLRAGSQIAWDLSGGAPVPAGLVYKAVGIPPGLKLDPATGLVTGLVTSAPKTFTVTTWAQVGTAKSAVNTATLVIGAFPAALVGSYEALLHAANEAALPAGKVSLKVAANGTFTGTLLTDDLAAFTLKGRLALAADNASGSASLTLSRGKILPAYRLDVAASTGTPALSSTLSAASATLGVSTDGARLLATAPVGAAGRYTVLLSAPANLGAVTEHPLGDGYATATIAANGTLALSGKNADGTKLAGSFPLGADHSYRVYAKPYALVGGYLAGTLPLSSRADNAARWHVAPAAGSDVYWRKPDPVAATTSYADGFGPLALSVRIEPWTALSKTTTLAPLLGLGSSGDLTLALAATGVANNETDPYGLPKQLTLSAANTFAVVGDNSSALFTAKVNPATGALGGAFTLKAIPPVAKRTVAYSGVLLQAAPADLPGLVGGGFFLLPAATRGGPALSGKVELATPSIK